VVSPRGGAWLLKAVTTSPGDFAPLKTWLNEHIHAHGRQYRAGELCEKVTGKPLSADPLMRYLEGRIRPIYGV
jgi:carboxypeptidase Taq